MFYYYMRFDSMVWGPTDLGHLINYWKGEDDQMMKDIQTMKT